MFSSLRAVKHGGADMGGRRRGELSSAGIDRGWPHQVALPEGAYVGHRYRTLYYFIEREGLSLNTRGHTFMRDDVWHHVFCFAEREHAELFRSKFGGEWMDPKDRPRWGKPKTQDKRGQADKA